MRRVDRVRVWLARLRHRVRRRFDSDICVDFEVQQWCDRVDALVQRGWRRGLTVAEWRELRRLLGEDGREDIAIAEAAIDDDDLLRRFLLLVKLGRDDRRVVICTIDALLAEHARRHVLTRRSR